MLKRLKGIEHNLASKNNQIVKDLQKLRIFSLENNFARPEGFEPPT
jgi:hypothetical protein